KVPGKPHDLSAEIDLVNAPRVLRDVEGDFTAQVTVHGPIRPKGASLVESRPPFNGAGLLVWQDRDNHLRLDRAAYLDANGRLVHYVNFELRKGGQIASQVGKWQFQLPLHLMLERRGATIHASVGYDGKTWVRLK